MHAQSYLKASWFPHKYFKRLAKTKIEYRQEKTPLVYSTVEEEWTAAPQDLALSWIISDKSLTFSGPKFL